MAETLTGAAIVTGGASGLGAATVTRLHEEGLAVVIADRNEDLGAALAARLGGDTTFVTTDVTDAAQVEAAVAQAAASHPDGLRLSVACAGIGIGERLLGRRGPHRVAPFRSAIEVNLVGTFQLLRAAAAVMAENDLLSGERGVHVSTASAAAFEGQVGQVAYAASKAGIVGLTLPAARDLAERGIRVCAIAPGLFDTPLMAALPEDARDALGRATPFPARLGRPEEFAELVVSIVRTTMLNGETIRLDGAIRLAPR